jgi:hypothetical protein
MHRLLLEPVIQKVSSSETFSVDCLEGMFVGFLDTFQEYVITGSHVRHGNLPIYPFQFTAYHPDIITFVSF